MKNILIKIKNFLSFFWIVPQLTLFVTTLLLIVSVTPFICTDESGTTKVLKQNGYKVIHVGGYRWFGGDKSDWWSTKFKAVTSQGDTINGYVTTGIFKGYTIRFEQ